MPSNEPTPTDQELVAAVLEGDQARYGDLVQRYQGRLVNYLCRMVRRIDEAQDVAQETFIKVYKALDRYDPKYRFSTWLFRVGQNAAIDHLRKQRVKLLSMEGFETADGDQRTWEFPSSEPTPYGNSRNLERRQAIQESIAALPWEYRELIVLRHFGELSYDEIAELKEMPLGTVKNKLFRGRQMLKEKLVDYLSD